MRASPLTDTIRLLILDDHALFREGAVRLLESEAGFHVAAQCASVHEAIESVKRDPVDLILLDYDLGHERGTDFLMHLRQLPTAPPVLVLTAGVSDRQAAELIAEGVSGIFPKTESPESLVEAIKRVVGGGTWFTERHRAGMLDLRIATTAPRPLSQREGKVLQGVVEGLANKEIGARLGISESSVKATLQQLFFKTGVRTRSQLVRVALERYREIVLDQR